MEIVDKIRGLFNRPDFKSKVLARQLMFMHTPLSRVVETYLQDNDGRLQSLNKFPMMRPIYDKMPRRLLLKCSRKTLKSTLLSNLISLNMTRYRHYKMLYVAPQEISAKYFSQHYLDARFKSPGLQKICGRFTKDDVFEKHLEETRSSCILRYAKEDATRIRGPATDQNVLDEVQDINYEILPIIGETMALSEFKREIFAGTPLTTDNTINVLWEKSTQNELATKCTGCNHWNTLTDDNDPLKMIMPHGLSCSKCSRVIDTLTGEWACTNPGKADYVGYHLAQPILPFFNQNLKEWDEIYRKVNNESYTKAQVYNEVFGLAYDTGSKPMTKEFLQNTSCLLGKMGEIHTPGSIYQDHKTKYKICTLGADWGVNMETSRTTVCMGGLRDDMVYEVFFMKVYKDFDYEAQIKDIAAKANRASAFCASDSGPDPNRGIRLAQMTSPTRTQLVRYEHGKFIQRYERPAGAIDWRQNRWCLHRSDTMTFVFNLIKKGKILFPQWEDSGECLMDILNIYTEVKEGSFGRQDLYYRHRPDKPDDFFHALNYAVCQAYVAIGDPVLNAPSSNAEDASDFGS